MIRSFGGRRTEDVFHGHATSLDAILMVDSLCFDGWASEDGDAAYLHRLLRLLRPGGRLIHHMDCRCDVTLPEVKTRFAKAGFSPNVLEPPVRCDAVLTESCRSEADERRGQFVGVFSKPAP